MIIELSRYGHFISATNRRLARHIPTDCNILFFVLFLFFVLLQTNCFSASPTFEDANSELPGVMDGSTDTGDFDGDGDLDVLLTGSINRRNLYISDLSK